MAKVAVAHCNNRGTRINVESSRDPFGTHQATLTKCGGSLTVCHCHVAID